MAASPSILIASPDRGIKRLLRRTFEAAGYGVTTADTGVAAVAATEQTEPDVAILSAEFGDVAGDQLIGQVRAISGTAIIALFYPDSAFSARELLDLGANDCVEEPFLVQELAARVRRLLLRAGVWLHPHSIATALGLIEIDPLGRSVRSGGVPVAHDDVVHRIWGKDNPNGRQNLRRVISSLRSRLESNRDHPVLLQNVRGLGYRLVVSDAAVGL